MNIKWYDKDKYPVPIFHPNGKVFVTIPHEWVCDLLKGDKSKKERIIKEYEKVKEEPPVAKASNLVVYEVILLTLGMSILMIVFLSKMMI